jgi:hypothetical protein
MYENKVCRGSTPYSYCNSYNTHKYSFISTGNQEVEPTFSNVSNYLK